MVRAKAAAAVAAVLERSPFSTDLTGDIIATKIVTIDGMHCENCKNSIEHQINRIDGASCEVNLKKKIATIQMDKPVDNDTIRRTIERLDFKVVDIKNA